MKKLLGILLTGGLLAGLSVTAGCASSRTDVAAEQSHAYTSGMMCPKCETVWVVQKKGQYAKASRLSHTQTMSCPDCDAMAESRLMDDGKTQLHDCPTCQVTPKPISTVEKPKHNKPAKAS